MSFLWALLLLPLVAACAQSQHALPQLPNATQEHLVKAE